MNKYLENTTHILVKQRNSLLRRYILFHQLIPYLRVYHIENYLIHHHVVLYGGSRSKIYWYHFLFIQ